MTGRLDFDADCNALGLPISGQTPAARHASFTGARKASQDRPTLALAYLALLRQAGAEGLSDMQAASALGRPLSSMCSTRNGLGDLVVASGHFEVSEWGTKRARWRLKRADEA